MKIDEETKHDMGEKSSETKIDELKGEKEDMKMEQKMEVNEEKKKKKKVKKKPPPPKPEDEEKKEEEKKKEDIDDDDDDDNIKSSSRASKTKTTSSSDSTQGSSWLRNCFYPASNPLEEDSGDEEEIGDGETNKKSKSKSKSKTPTKSNPRVAKPGGADPSLSTMAGCRIQ